MPASPTPPKRPPLTPLQWALAGSAVTLGAVVLVVVSHGTTASPAAAAPVSAMRPLDHVVAYKSRLGFQVCSRTPLRRCILDFVSDASGTARTVRIGPVDVDPVPNCETIMGDANAACADGGFGPGMRWARCAALHGFISRTLARTLDPRDDPHAHPPGGFILNCEEGYLNGSFDDTM